MTSYLKTGFITIITVLTLNLSAQDAEGCKDHPFFNRMQNFLIEACRTNFDAYEFPVGANEKKQTEEGNLTVLNYVFNEESGAKMPSGLQILKNYENAIISKGGKKVYATKEDGAAFTFSQNGKDYWVGVTKLYEPGRPGEVSSFELAVLEKSGMQQEIQASEMFSEISKSGHVALYINFDTGKSTIKPESEGVVSELIKMLKSNPSLKISVEGHTDNTGNAAANKTLSESRAKAVVDKLVAGGIDKSRLTSQGWGQEKPVADNKTEEGKAKNRRVEIVKK